MKFHEKKVAAFSMTGLERHYLSDPLFTHATLLIYEMWCYLPNQVFYPNISNPYLIFKN